MRFADASPRLRCGGTAPEICLGPGYEHLRGPIGQVVSGPFAAFADAGFEPPQRITQDVLDVATGSVLVGGEVPTVSDVQGLLVFAIIPPDCDLYRDEATYKAFSNVWDWVGALLGLDVGFDPDVDPTIAAGDSPGSRAIVREIQSELRSCHSSP